MSTKFDTPHVSFFIVDKIDLSRNVVVLDDEDFGLQIEVNIGNKELKEAKIIGEYRIALHYKDGTTVRKQFLK